MLKPLDESRFKNAVVRALKRKEVEENNIGDFLRRLKAEKKTAYESNLFVQKSDKLFNLPVDEILHLEASGDYTIITTVADQFVSSLGIGRLVEMLNPEIFIRVHRSTIINVHSLKEIERHFNGGLVVKMQNNKSFAVSRSYAKEIRKKIV